MKMNKKSNNKKLKFHISHKDKKQTMSIKIRFNLNKKI